MFSCKPTLVLHRQPAHFRIMTANPEAFDFARRQAVRRADDAKKLDEVLGNLLRSESTRLLGERWLQEAVEHYVSLGDEPLGDADFMIVSVWILYHYRSPATDDRPFAEWWAERQRLRREPAKARLVQAHVDAPIGLWEVQEIESGHGSRLRDLLSGEEVFVLDRASTTVLQPWLVLCGYVVQVDGIAFIGGVHLQPLAPAHADRVLKYARKIARTRRKLIALETRSDEQFQAALLGVWRVAVEQISSPQSMPELRNIDGDLLELQRDEFVLNVPPHEVIANLASVPGAQVPERQGRRTEIVITAAPRMNMSMLGGDSAVGLIIVTDKRLRIESNSLARADTLRAAVEAAVGNGITFRARVSDNLSAAVAERRDTRAPVAEAPDDAAFIALNDPATMPPELLAHLNALAEQEQLRWPDYELPALDGMTPRAAARDKRMRPRLILLLKDFEASQATALRANPLALDVPRLRRELGV